MAQSFKVLGQINPTANSQANVYSVPVGTEAVISTIAICNQTGSNASYSLIVIPGNEAFSDPANAKHFVVRGATVPAADTIMLTVGITANTGTLIACNTNSNNISFSIFGSEIV